MERFDSHSPRHFPEITEVEYGQAVDYLDTRKQLDVPTETKVRTEQQFLRQRLFGNRRTGICGLCGKEFPVEFLVTAHIKKRAACTRGEKLDY